MMQTTTRLLHIRFTGDKEKPLVAAITKETFPQALIS
jgi:hypothetical protein